MHDFIYSLLSFHVFNRETSFYIFVGIVVMIIQHFVPTSTDDDSALVYYGNVMVWVCGTFALIGVALALSIIPIRIGERRKTDKT